MLKNFEGELMNLGFADEIAAATFTFGAERQS